MKRHLVIIPGLSDRARLYRLFVPLWSLLGYEVHIFVFGWKNPSVNFTVALKRLVKYIDNLNTNKCYLIGVSAGGTAAINTLVARPEAIARVVTVCTPYSPMPKLGNNLLDLSLNRVAATLSHINTDLYGRILSVHAMYDGVVPVAKSKPNGIAQKALFSFGHGVTIGLALSVYSWAAERFLKQ